MRRWPCRSPGRHHPPTSGFVLPFLLRCRPGHLAGAVPIALVQASIGIGGECGSLLQSMHRVVPIHLLRNEELTSILRVALIFDTQLYKEGWVTKAC